MASKHKKRSRFERREHRLQQEAEVKQAILAGLRVAVSIDSSSKGEDYILEVLRRIDWFDINNMSHANMVKRCMKHIERNI